MSNKLTELTKNESLLRISSSVSVGKEFYHGFVHWAVKIYSHTDETDNRSDMDMCLNDTKKDLFSHMNRCFHFIFTIYDSRVCLSHFLKFSSIFQEWTWWGEIFLLLLLNEKKKNTLPLTWGGKKIIFCLYHAPI